MAKLIRQKNPSLVSMGDIIEIDGVRYIVAKTRGTESPYFEFKLINMESGNLWSDKPLWKSRDAETTKLIQDVELPE